MSAAERTSLLGRSAPPPPLLGVMAPPDGAPAVHTCCGRRAPCRSVDASHVVLRCLLALGFAGSVVNAVFVARDLNAGTPDYGGRNLHDTLAAVGGIFAGFAVPLTAYDICMHLTHYRYPLQRFYIRVLWMVIIYAIESYAALRKSSDRVYLETAFAAYEAFTLYSFFNLCVEFLGPRAVLIDTLERIGAGTLNEGRTVPVKPRSRWTRILIDGDCSGKRAPKPHVPDGYAVMLAPCCCLRRWKMGSEFLEKSSFGVVQYVVVRVLCAVAVFGMQATGVYGENEFVFTDGYVYVVAVINASQIWALYTLILFGYHLWDALEPLRPLGKFAVIKWIVFVSWWQSVFISAINSTPAIPSDVGGMTDDELAAAVQDLLICAEMVAAAVAHHTYFSYADFDRPDVIERMVASLPPPSPLVRPEGDDVELGGLSALEGGGKGAPRTGIGRFLSRQPSAVRPLQRSLSQNSLAAETHASASSPAAGKGAASFFPQRMASPSQILGFKGGLRSAAASDAGRGTTGAPDVGSRDRAQSAQSAFPHSIAGALRAEGHAPTGGFSRSAVSPSSSGASASTSSPSGRPLGLLAAVTDMVLPVDVIVDFARHGRTAAAAVGGWARRERGKGGGKADEAVRESLLRPPSPLQPP